MRVFTINRDSMCFGRQPKSDQPVLTQFDTGVYFQFQLFHQETPYDLTGCQVFITFKTEDGEILLSEACPLIQELSLDSQPRVTFLSDERLTKKSGLIYGMLDLIDEEGYRTAFPPFGVIVRPHLLKESIVIK